MTETTFRYAYLHGFASSALSFKGTQLAERFARRGVELELPDLNHPSFAELTYSGALEALDALDAAAPDARWRFIGSSMGGYLAARWAGLNPERVDRMVLLCPGFDMNKRWMQIVGPEAMARWWTEGRLMIPGPDKTPTPVHWRFIEDGLSHPPYPAFSCPALIVHGRRDEVVPIDSSRAYAAEHEHVALVEVDDDHGLTASVDALEAQALAFFEL